ncbi:M23 family metallopeptidase [Iodobacter sp.]|uniref:M23 family metallopeptidase n=1 Tax=Iodobacter sp. TaxID=1915058 RepID=UPI0025E85548|nr:M23 family metallopeptidase [Iodobacter sp.]
MNIIVMSNRLGKAVSLDSRQIICLALLMLLLVASIAFALGSLIKPSSNQALWRLMPGNNNTRQTEIDALAIRVGELQAKLLRLDGLASQVGNKTGIDIKPFLSNQPVPRGGIQHTGTPLTAATLGREIDAASSSLNARLDQLALAESILLQPKAWQLPSKAPLNVGLQSSSFGKRIDPFNGNQVFHEGIDFVGETGTPIMAAASGKVSFAAFHPQYGNMVDLDHGNGITSRYAHASKLDVKVGEQINAGQTIALLGSTGRSTGPHLHFEIRYKGIAQNPLRFIGPANKMINFAEIKSGD